MEIRFSDLLFYFLAEKDPNFILTETPGGCKIVEWIYAEDSLFVGFFSYDNVLITWHFE